MGSEVDFLLFPRAMAACSAISVQEKPDGIERLFHVPAMLSG